MANDISNGQVQAAARALCRNKFTDDAKGLCGLDLSNSPKSRCRHCDGADAARIENQARDALLAAALYDDASTEPYVSKGTPLTPLEAELLTILNEECLEVGIAVTKLLRFGKEINPRTNEPNINALSREMGDLDAMLDIVCQNQIADADLVSEGYARKIERLRKFLQKREGANVKGIPEVAA